MYLSWLLSLAWCEHALKLLVCAEQVDMVAVAEL